MDKENKMCWIYIIRDFLSQILFHEEDFADLLAWTLYHSQHQRVITALQFDTLWGKKSGHHSRHHVIWKGGWGILPEKTWMEWAALTATCMHEVDCKVIRAVFDFKLVEENSQHLRRRHAAVDANIGHRAVSRREYCCLRVNTKHSNLYSSVMHSNSKEDFFTPYAFG